MSKKKLNIGTHKFGVKSEGKTEVYVFIKKAFMYNKERFETESLFDGENLKSEHAAMVTELVRIQSGIIQKTDQVLENTTADLESVQAEYEELTGKKPGNKKLETLLKEIETIKFKAD